MEPMEWPLKSFALGKVSWRFQSAFTLGLVGLSSKIFLRKMLLLYANDSRRSFCIFWFKSQCYKAWKFGLCKLTTVQRLKS